MTLEIHPEAVDEFEQAARYYAKRQPGLEQRFIACVDSALRRVAGESERWPLFEEDIRRRLVHIFPFAVLYSIESECVLVVAIMHCSREPGYWRNRRE